MNRRTLTFIAIACSIVYGTSFSLFTAPQWYRTVGSLVVALAWIAVGLLSRRDGCPRRTRA